MLREEFVNGSSAIAAHGLSDDSKPCWRKCFLNLLSKESCTHASSSPNNACSGLGGGPGKIEESKRKHFSVSTLGPPTKPLTRAVSPLKTMRTQ